jgi:hypothetical protein
VIERNGFDFLPPSRIQSKFQIDSKRNQAMDLILFYFRFPSPLDSFSFHFFQPLDPVCTPPPPSLNYDDIEFRLVRKRIPPNSSLMFRTRIEMRAVQSQQYDLQHTRTP